MNLKYVMSQDHREKLRLLVMFRMKKILWKQMT